MDKKLYKGGIVVFCVLIVLSAIFYKERTILLDNSLYLFEMARSGSFCIQHNRFIAVFSEFPAYVALKLNLSLKHLALAYSVGYMLFHFICYLLCGFLRSYKLAVALLLTHTLILTHTFFWHLSEIPTGISLLFVLLALMDKPDTLRDWLLYPIVLLITCTIALAHPLMLIPIMFIAVFITLNNNIVATKGTKLIIAVAAMAILILAVKKMFFTSNYEKGTMGAIRNFIKLFPDYYSQYSFQRFAEHLGSIYYWLPILLVLIMGTYIYKRYWLKLVLVTGAFLAHLTLVNVCFNGPSTPDLYWENLYLFLSFFLAVPLVYDVIPTIRNKYVIPVLTVLVACTAVYRIIDTRDLYKNRLDWYRTYLQKSGGGKVLASAKSLPKDIMIMEWASPYEFWLLSTLETDSTASILINEEVDTMSWAAPVTNEFVTTWGLYKYDDLNPRYFKFRDTVTSYRLVY